MTSPFAPKMFPALPTIAGLQVGTACSGERYRNRLDVALFVLPESCTVAGVFTQSATAAPPVDWSRRHIGGARALLVNAGNANAFSGVEGERSMRACAEAVANRQGLALESVMLASTGVIGEPLDAGKIVSALPRVVVLEAHHWEQAARAIMTTDTFAKGAGRVIRVKGGEIRIAGIAKGSGMIAPNMATMLAFVFTDIRAPRSTLQRLWSSVTETTFNAVTVDGDTSTSDCALLLATGTGAALDGDEDERAFSEGLHEVCEDLARQIAGDGEGLSKRITIVVTGAHSDEAARRIGLTIGGSPLVKTAIGGEDANWGRVVMAVGRAGEQVQRERLSIAFGGVMIARAGQRVPGYDEGLVAAHLRGREVLIEVDLGLGSGSAVVWSCDLTRGYIDINGSYRS